MSAFISLKHGCSEAKSAERRFASKFKICDLLREASLRAFSFATLIVFLTKLKWTTNWSSNFKGLCRKFLQKSEKSLFQVAMLDF